MGLTVNRQMAKKITVNCQKRNIFTVNRQMSEPKLAVKFLRYPYSLSHKTVNARENFWNVYCFATNQMRDETAKDNRQTAEEKYFPFGSL